MEGSFGFVLTLDLKGCFHSGGDKREWCVITNVAEPQRDAVPALAPTVLAPNLMVNRGEITKMLQTVTASYLPHSFIYRLQVKSERIRKNCHNFNVNFCLFFKIVFLII
jgi:hypothetical protein